MTEELFPKSGREPSFQWDRESGTDDDAISSSHDEQTADGRRYISGFTVIAWFVILVCVVAIVFLVGVQQLNQQDSPVFSKAELLQPILVGKYVLGLKALEFPGLDEQKQVFENLNTGPLEQRYCYAILVNELTSPEQALRALDDVDKAAKQHGIEQSESQARLNSILRSLFQSYQLPDWQAANVSDDDRNFLVEQLVWYGRLALAPKGKTPATERRQLVDRAKLTVYFMAAAVGLLILTLMLGLVGLVIYLVLLFKGSLVPHFRDQSKYGAVYAETFAIWIVLFIGGSMAPLIPAIGKLNLIGLPLVMSMFALMWPMLRGIPFSHFCEDVGWKLKNPFKEVFAAVTAYISMLPILAVCLLMVFFLLVLAQGLMGPVDEFAPRGGAGHPIAEEAFGGNPLASIAKILILTVIVAPIVEETMFRGILYRHLRDTTSRMERWMSVVISALVSSFIFAAIHPQGILTIPLLMPLAFGFALVREWRGSLIAPITMHAIHNSLATMGLVMVTI